ncbi:MAG: hypothetical protein RLY86_2600 [Pseudomonadota bacterium]|jgi:hypothetical protein
MIKFALKCQAGHTFEGWFRNGDAYEEQAAANAIPCPVCGGTRVAKAPMAPAIARSGSRAVAAAGDSPDPAALMQQLRALRQAVEGTAEHVGDRFAEEARKIHYGEVEHRAIYGDATPDQVADLREEGVQVARIPWVPRHDA